LGAEPSEDLGERNESKWMDSDGNIKWPPNGGFDGKTEKTILEPGTIIDRYGKTTGNYTSPFGTDYSSRSLAPGTKSNFYLKYKVLKPIEVEFGKIAPWFDEPGGGIQYRHPERIIDLLKNEKIEQIE
jgi:hypothetical protein